MNVESNFNFQGVMGLIGERVNVILENVIKIVEQKFSIKLRKYL